MEVMLGVSFLERSLRRFSLILVLTCIGGKLNLILSKESSESILFDLSLSEDFWDS